MNITNEIKKHVRAGGTTITELVESLDVDTIEAEEAARLTLHIIDPPIINGINLREHPNPHQRTRYTKVLDNGGKICVLRLDGRNSMIFTETATGNLGTTTDDFESQRRLQIKEMIIGRSLKELGTLMDDTPRKRGKYLRPKALTPEDFWAQLDEKERLLVDVSSDADVLSFVEYINNLSKVKLTTKKVKNGLDLLFAKNIITRATRDNLQN